MWAEKVEKIMALMCSNAEDRQMALSLLDGLVETARTTRETTGKMFYCLCSLIFFQKKGIIGRIKDESVSVPSYFPEIDGWKVSRWRPTTWGDEDVVLPLTDLYFRYYPSRKFRLSQYVTVQNLFSSPLFLRGCTALVVHHPFDISACKKW